MLGHKSRRNVLNGNTRIVKLTHENSPSLHRLKASGRIGLHKQHQLVVYDGLEKVSHSIEGDFNQNLFHSPPSERRNRTGKGGTLKNGG